MGRYGECLSSVGWEGRIPSIPPGTAGPRSIFGLFHVYSVEIIFKGKCTDFCILADISTLF